MYKVTIKPKSFFKSNLTSITLSGAIFSTIADVLDENILDQIYSGKETLVVSNIYPDGCILKDYDYLLDSCGNTLNYRYDRVDFVRKSYNGVFRGYTNGFNGLMYFLIETTLNKDVLENILNITFTNGIGAMKSVGYGSFDVVSIKDFKIDDTDSNGYMTLSDYIPNKDDSTFGDFTARIIRSLTHDGKEKAPVYVVNAGSKFFGKLKSNIIGQIIKDENTGSFLSGQSLVIPIKISD